ncbi:MAG: outer membrane beta-barrel protein [Gemmatimonadota bacterium]|nr:outer membrane beta-barrel protein [Gemmatimonadota bacterium]
MRSTRSVIVGLCGGLTLFSGIADAQLPSPGERDPGGRVYAKVIVTITGESGSFGHPVSGLRFLVVAENGDRVSIRSDDAGVASTWVFPGTYRLVTPDPYEWDGNAYTWDAVVAIRPGTGLIRLSQANASRIVALSPSPPARNRARQTGRTTGSEDGGAVSSITEGFFLAPHLLGASLEFEDEEVESGGGGGLTIGYGFTRMFSAFFTIDGASVDIRDPDISGDYTLAQADLGARLNFRSETRKAIPYIEAALTGRAAETTVEGVDIQLSGPAFTLGGGLNYYFQQKLALDVGLSLSFGRFDTLEIDGDEVPYEEADATGTRFRVGLTWYPFASNR